MLDPLNTYNSRSPCWISCDPGRRTATGAHIMPAPSHLSFEIDDWVLFPISHDRDLVVRLAWTGPANCLSIEKAFLACALAVK